MCVVCFGSEFGGRSAANGCRATRRRRAILLCKCTLFFAARQLSTRHSPTPTSFLFRSVGVGAAGVNRVTTANQITPTTSTQTATTKRRSPKSFRRTTTLSSAWIASHLTRFVVVFSCKHCGPSTLRGASTDECGNCYIQAMQWDLSDSRTELMTQGGEYQHADGVAAGAAEQKAEHYLRIGQRKLEENKRRQVVTASNQRKQAFAAEHGGLVLKGDQSKRTPTDVALFVPSIEDNEALRAGDNLRLIHCPRCSELYCRNNSLLDRPLLCKECIRKQVVVNRSIFGVSIFVRFLGRLLDRIFVEGIDLWSWV